MCVLVLLILFLLLQLVLLVPLGVRGNSGILFGEHAGDAGDDFVMDDGLR